MFKMMLSFLFLNKILLRFFPLYSISRVLIFLKDEIVTLFKLRLNDGFKNLRAHCADWWVCIVWLSGLPFFGFLFIKPFFIIKNKPEMEYLILPGLGGHVHTEYQSNY